MDRFIELIFELEGEARLRAGSRGLGEITVSHRLFELLSNYWRVHRRNLLDRVTADKYGRIIIHTPTSSVVIKAA